MLKMSKAILGLVAATGVLVATGLDCLLHVSHWRMLGAEDGPLKSSIVGVFTDMGENPAADRVRESPTVVSLRAILCLQRLTVE